MSVFNNKLIMLYCYGAVFNNVSIVIVLYVNSVVFNNVSIVIVLYVNSVVFALLL